MKALAILAACTLAALSTPALAWGNAAGFHAAAPGKPGAHRHFGRAVIGLGWIGVVPEIITAPTQAAAEQASLADIPPARRCLTETPVATPNPGPHIIYIGQKPVINGPKVIYGTN